MTLKKLSDVVDKDVKKAVYDQLVTKFDDMEGDIHRETWFIE